MNETIRQLELEKAKGRIRYYGYCNFGVQNMTDGEAAGGKPISNQASHAVPATRARFSMRHELWLAVKKWYSVNALHLYLVQLPYNLLWRAAEHEILPKARQLDLSVPP